MREHHNLYSLYLSLLIQHAFSIYSVQITVGKAQQSLWLSIDTGSSDIWIADTSCSSSACSDAHTSLYDPASAIQVGQPPLNLTYLYVLTPFTSKKKDPRQFSFFTSTDVGLQMDPSSGITSQSVHTLSQPRLWYLPHKSRMSCCLQISSVF